MKKPEPKRCHWCGEDPLYVEYHDTEWGVPERDHRALFEKLILDGFQAGLSWITILRKRENFRKAFDGFEPAKIARYTPRKVETLMQDAGIVRNRAKIEGTVKSAQSWLRLMEQRKDGFSGFIWQATDGRVLQPARQVSKDIPTESKESQALSKALRAEGFNFVGPTIVYAFMQAVGMVNDHVVTCHRHKALSKGA
jgi:DNA-3-methyladenine glycosylase I